MATFGDYVSITTTGTSEVTGTISLSGPAKIIEILVAGEDTDAFPVAVRLEWTGIKTPQKYLLGVINKAAGTEAGPSLIQVRIPVDVDVPSNISQVTLGLTATGAGTWKVGLKWVA